MDYSIEYCGDMIKPEFRAIINDEGLMESKIITIYGGSDASSPRIRIFKQAGYAISLFFLLLTLILHCTVNEIRKVHKNMLCPSLHVLISSFFLECAKIYYDNIDCTMLQHF